MATSSSELTGGIRGPFGPPRLASNGVAHSRKIVVPKALATDAPTSGAFGAEDLVPAAR